MIIPQNLSFEGFFPLADHVIHGNPYARNNIRKSFYIGNQALTAISYTDFAYGYSWIYLSFARLMRVVCFLNWFLFDYTLSVSKILLTTRTNAL